MHLLRYIWKAQRTCNSARRYYIKGNRIQIRRNGKNKEQYPIRKGNICDKNTVQF